jgi:methionyl-tRNA synthetase
MKDNCELINTTDISFWNCMKNQTYVNDQYHSLDCEYIKSLGCENGVCDMEYIEPHQIIGKQQPMIIKMFPVMVILILMISFAANHLLYEWRKNNDKF